MILENSAEYSPTKIEANLQRNCFENNNKNENESKANKKSQRKFVSLKSQVEEFFSKRSCEVSYFYYKNGK